MSDFGDFTDEQVDKAIEAIDVLNDIFGEDIFQEDLRYELILEQQRREEAADEAAKSEE